MMEYPTRFWVGCFHFESFSKTFHFPLTTLKNGSTIYYRTNKCSVQQKSSLWRTVEVRGFGRGGDGYGAVVVANG